MCVSSALRANRPPCAWCPGPRPPQNPSKIHSWTSLGPCWPLLGPSWHQKSPKSEKPDLGLTRVRPLGPPFWEAFGSFVGAKIDMKSV